MFSVLKKDIAFTKKIILISSLYSVIVPLLLLLDSDGKTYFADFLIPLAFVTAPMSKIMNKEDTKSGIILQKMLPISTSELVGARYLFMILLMLSSELILSLMKVLAFHQGTLISNSIDELSIMILFSVYFAVYLTVYYWKGYFATQFCINALIIVVVLSNKIIGNDTLVRLFEMKKLLFLIGLCILIISYIASCFFLNKRTVDA